MDEANFSMALAAISSGVYDDGDIKAIKAKLADLNKREIALKREIEKTKIEFVKNKGKSESKLKAIRSDIKSLKNILYKI